MNGRVYDYNLGRFMSVDPFIQSPTNTQSINPYSYIMNNPMAGTDPTGYLRVCETFIVCSQDQMQDDNFNKHISSGSSTSSSNGQNNEQKGSNSNASNDKVNVGNQNGTNVENSDISGSSVGGKKPEEVDANFKIDKIKGHDDGWEDPHEAALAFYKQNEDAYQNTDKNTELTGFLIKADNGNYYFTNAVEVPATFNMNVGIRKPTSWKIKDTLHTHPGGRGNQEGFSKTDAQAVLSGSTPDIMFELLREMSGSLINQSPRGPDRDGERKVSRYAQEAHYV
ncbi:hypothetical protein PN838_11710 [Psychrosphaera sp. G1-22]|uniref:RHS repeat-associated core domain-containing protein n=1 Tax=Psychrosphaera algicola TaxID=3023714 RepID=A0ABT5FE09_9GAMM|nr:RHS repeat-associated core domain-containing protein [Psychrosphaera sp. G1-22]MDC2889324.1 hypothetical protein [Psychrosphaera sp. G1-22]